jgi:UDP-N-acetylglucosamine--dolichyl-phosphate N-acetylglucosaminephosphotransferase
MTSVLSCNGPVNISIRFDKVGMSTTKFKYNQLNFIGKLFVKIFKLLHLLDIKENVGEGGQYTECNNMTLINLILMFTGPLHERTLVILLFVIYKAGCEPMPYW